MSPNTLPDVLFYYKGATLVAHNKSDRTIKHIHVSMVRYEGDVVTSKPSYDAQNILPNEKCQIINGVSFYSSIQNGTKSTYATSEYFWSLDITNIHVDGVAIPKELFPVKPEKFQLFSEADINMLFSMLPNIATLGIKPLYEHVGDVGKKRMRTAGKVLGGLIGIPTVALCTLAVLAQFVRNKENAIDRENSDVASKAIYVSIKAGTKITDINCVGLPLLSNNEVLKKTTSVLVLGKVASDMLHVRTDDNYFFNHQFQTCVFDVKQENVVVPRFWEIEYAKFLKSADLASRGPITAGTPYAVTTEELVLDTITLAKVPNKLPIGTVAHIQKLEGNTAIVRLPFVPYPLNQPMHRVPVRLLTPADDAQGNIKAKDGESKTPDGKSEPATGKKTTSAATRDIPLRAAFAAMAGETRGAVPEQAFRTVRIPTANCVMGS